MLGKGAVGELLSAVAVLATLGYLAVQIRQNTRSLEDNRRVEIARHFQTRTDQRLRFHELMIGNEDLLLAQSRLRNSTWPTTLELYKSLSDEARERYFHYLKMQILNAESIFVQEGLGLVDDELYSNTKEMISRSGHLWKAVDALSGVRPSFVKFVDEILEGGA